jgi:outer membrane protein TolC
MAFFRNHRMMQRKRYNLAKIMAAALFVFSTAALGQGQKRVPCPSLQHNVQKGINNTAPEEKRAPSPPRGETSEVPKIGLKAALERALARNPSMVSAKLDIQRAEALLRMTLAGSLPVLSANAGYIRRSEQDPAKERTPGEANTFSANLSLSLPLVHPQRWLQYRRGKKAVAIARAEELAARRLLAVAVAKAYLTLLAQHRVIEINQRALDTARAHLAFAQKRYAGGAGTKVEETRAAQEAARVEAQLELALGGLTREQEALGVLLGADGPQDIAAPAVLDRPPPLETALAQAATRRSDLRLQSARLGAAKDLLRDSWTDFVPYLTALFQPFYQNPPSAMQPQTGWQLQLMLTFPLYDGGMRYGQQRERRMQVATAQATLEGLIRQSRSEVRAAYASMLQAQKAARAAGQAALLGQEAFALAQQAYEAGATTNLELIDAARQARDAQTAAVIAEDNAQQARLELLVASGHFP